MAIKCRLARRIKRAIFPSRKGSARKQEVSGPSVVERHIHSTSITTSATNPRRPGSAQSIRRIRDSDAGSHLFQTSPSDSRPKVIYRLSNPSLHDGLESLRHSSESDLLPDLPGPQSFQTGPDTEVRQRWAGNQDESIADDRSIQRIRPTAAGGISDEDTANDSSAKFINHLPTKSNTNLSFLSFGLPPSTIVLMDGVNSTQTRDAAEIGIALSTSTPSRSFGPPQPSIVLTDGVDSIQTRDAAEIGIALSTNTLEPFLPFYPVLTDFSTPVGIQGRGDGSRYPEFIFPERSHGEASARATNFSKREFTLYNKDKPLPELPPSAGSPVDQSPSTQLSREPVSPVTLSREQQLLSDQLSPEPVSPLSPSHEQQLPDLPTAPDRPLSCHSSTSTPPPSNPDEVFSSLARVPEGGSPLVCTGSPVYTHNNNRISHPHHHEFHFPQTRTAHHTADLLFGRLVPLISGAQPPTRGFSHRIAAHVRSGLYHRAHRYGRQDQRWSRENYLKRLARPRSLEECTDEDKVRGLRASIERREMFLRLTEPLQEFGEFRVSFGSFK
ncbi:hypothetical protein MMC13_004412 [Lambiella insularis]|nr:hypothetical protein [Lambiella insularis]